MKCKLVFCCHRRDFYFRYIDHVMFNYRIEEDDLIEQDLSQLDLQPKEKCVIQ
jgi:hypothetical protein